MKKEKHLPEDKSNLPKENKSGNVYGFHPVDQLLHETGFYKTDKLFIAYGEHPRMQSIITRAKKAGVEIVKINSVSLTEMAGSEKHQGIILSRQQPITLKTIDMDDIMENRGVYVVLDGVQDPGNVGAIFRSIAALGAKGIILSRHNSAPIGESVYKSSAGSMMKVPIMHVGGIAGFLLNMQKKGALTVGISMEGSPINAKMVANLKEHPGSILLVMGSEGHGLSQLVEKRCEVLLKIPQTNHVESLNVSVATGIVLYEFCSRTY